MLREALIKAPYELFSIKGFDETRVENITEKIDVSTHTFFRYFFQQMKALSGNISFFILSERKQPINTFPP
ncbi:TetR family transcriptional regulator [Xenorhabdus bovienii]|uniref:TetR family transcriptional regulator n=1 Tax=Xenorhabdus bovienii TaxID=40576 RepID=UPI0023B25660|nr:TetR family transcriptional regulator [Xenorhabdus bovienii]